MLECLTEWVMPPLYSWPFWGRFGAGRAAYNMVTPYGAYACGDGPVNFAIQNEREWRRFCEQVMEMPRLADDARFAGNGCRLENRSVLEEMIEAEFGRHTRAEILARLEAAGIANGAVNDVAEVARHPQLEARGRWAQVDSPVGPIAALVPPHNLQNAPARMGAVPALMAAHGRDPAGVGDGGGVRWGE